MKSVQLLLILLSSVHAFLHPSTKHAFGVHVSDKVLKIRLFSSEADEVETDGTTLYDRIGGKAALTAAVDEFYARLVEDEVLKPYFEGVSIAKLKGHQFNFMRTAFVKIPDDLNVHDYLINGHERLFKMGMGGEAFDVVAGHLVGALKALEVPDDLIDEAVGIVAPLRVYFVEGQETYSGKE